MHVARILTNIFFVLAGIALPALPQTPCQAVAPFATLTVPYSAGHPQLTLDPESAVWKRPATAVIDKDCSSQIRYPDTETQIRAFWTDTDLYFLFRCRYTVLNLFLPPQNDAPRVKLWDRDVVEMFLGADWANIRQYREFEVAPTGDWIDLAIDLDRKSYDHSWRSGWQTMARIDEKGKVWYAAVRIPLSSVSSTPVQDGTKWRANLYRIDGLGPDSERHFICWQPTCVSNRDPNHVPEHFGTLVFSRQ